MMGQKGNTPEMITPAEMAPRLGAAAEDIRRMMREGSFPIGWVDNPSGKRYTYHIVRAEFEAMMAGKLPTANKYLARLIAEELNQRMENAG